MLQKTVYDEIKLHNKTLFTDNMAAERSFELDDYFNKCYINQIVLPNWTIYRVKKKAHSADSVYFM